METICLVDLGAAWYLAPMQHDCVVRIGADASAMAAAAASYQHTASFLMAGLLAAVVVLFVRGVS
jgi:uncharacterized membrane protein